MNREATQAQVVRRFAIVGLAAPALVTAVAVAIQVSALPQPPDRIATHWTITGQADGHSPAWVSPLVTGLLGLGLAWLIALCALPALRRGARGPSFRLIGATAPALAAFVCTATTWTLLAQVGSDGAEAQVAIWPPLLCAFGASFVVGALAWFAQPAQDTVQPTRTEAGTLDLGDSERAVWIRSISVKPALPLLLISGTVVLGAAAILTWLLGPASLIFPFAVSALSLLIATATVSFRVRVDQSGLTVRSALGVPRFHVASNDISAVETVEVNPVGDFGGWGMRVSAAGPRRFGVVLRTGEAIQVSRRSGRIFVVTVDDAKTGAALLRTFSERHQPAS